MRVNDGGLVPRELCFMNMSNYFYVHNRLRYAPNTDIGSFDTLVMSLGSVS